MNLRWSSQNGLSRSAIVKSSAVWFFVVPLAARILEKFDKEVAVNISGKEYVFELALPFYWQLLFFASFFFMLAGIVYNAKASSLVKIYSSFQEFTSDGNSRLQINRYLKEVVWDDAKMRIYPAYNPVVEKYLATYYSISDEEFALMESNESEVLDVMEDLTRCVGDDNDAFYFVHNTADTANGPWIKTSAVLYASGFLCVAAIVVMNVIYVVQTF